MSLVARDQADIMNVDPEDLFLAGSIFQLKPYFQEKYGDRKFIFVSLSL